MTTVGLAGRFLRAVAVITALAALGLQLFLELVLKGMGSGFSPASASPFVWVVVAPLPIIFSGLAFLTRDGRSGLRAAITTLAGHCLMAGFVWMTVSTPHDLWAGQPTTWLDDNPRIAGTMLFLIGCGILAGLIVTRRRTSTSHRSPA